MKNKKAQVTLFMLIGILILGGAALTFYAVETQTKQQLERKADEVTQQLLKTTALEEYATLCLKEAAEKGIKLLGEQGGVIYESEGGTTPDYGYPLPYGLLSLENTVMENDIEERYDVKYLIRSPTLSARSIVHPDVPEYPYPGPVYPQTPQQLSNFHFGTIKLDVLCDPAGPNRRGGVLFSSCETYGSQSIQKELSDYIDKNLEGCIDFGNLSQILGYNITQGNPSTNATFTENSIILDSDYPLSITIKNKQISKIVNFKTTLPIRLKTIHEFLYNLIERESNDLFFNLSRDYMNFTAKGKQYWTPGITLTLSKDACQSCTKIFGAPWDDIVTITDQNSVYQGEPFRFVFAIKNRIPVLDYIHTPNPYPELYDVVALENSTLNISPTGYDPDDDELEFSYHLWKADYDEEFKGPNPEDVTKLSSYTSGNQWETSDSYRNTLREATVEVGRKDIGVHLLNVTVKDNQGLMDWQVVRILVNDMPEVDLKGNNQFSDIDNSLASIEDPYKLDGSGTVALFQRGLTYSFSDEPEAHGEFASGPESVIYVPPEENQQIDGIKPYMFTLLGPHTISLSVSDNMGVGATGFGSEAIDIEVKQCLPHQKTGTAPYPFNYFEERNTNSAFDKYANENNTFQATHECCTSEYYYKPQGTNCFNSVDYGPITSYQNVKYDNGLTYLRDLSNSFGYSAQNYIQNSLPSQMTNERKEISGIFKRTITAECNGERGNICNDNPTEKIEQVQICEPAGYSSSQELCVGPPKESILGKSFSLKPQTCTQYTGETFEDLLADIGHTSYNKFTERGICDDDFKCTTSEYGEGGIYSCQASCSNGGCTQPAHCVCSDSDTKDGVGVTASATGCSATCDQATDSSDDFGAGGDTCNFGCNTNTGTATSCKYTQAKTCPTQCVVKQSKYPNPSEIINPDCEQNVGYKKTENYYCLYGRQCTSEGCRYTLTAPMPKDSCGSCTYFGLAFYNACPSPQYNLNLMQTSNPLDDTCSYGCNDYCTDYSGTQKCPQYTVSSTSIYNPSSTPKSAHTITQTEYCLTRISTGCDESGCHIENDGTLRRYYCDTCTSQGWAEGEKCYPVTTNEQYKNGCSSNCPNSGTYNYYKSADQTTCTGPNCNVIPCTYKPGYTAVNEPNRYCACDDYDYGSRYSECENDCRTWYDNQGFYESQFDGGSCDPAHDKCICKYKYPNFIDMTWYEVSCTLYTSTDCH